MATNFENSLGEGQDPFSPPMFDGTNYTYWKGRMRIFIQSINYTMWQVIFNNLNINDSKYDYLNATAIELLKSALDSHVQNRISSYISAHDIWNKLKNIYEHNLYEHDHINIDESNDISPVILVTENIVNSNQELEKIELSISDEDYHLKLTQENLEKNINDMAKSYLISNEKDEDHNEESYTHSFSNDSFDDHSALYYDDDVIEIICHMMNC